jgi:hypothetical protein
MLAMILEYPQSSMLKLTSKIPIRDENLVEFGRSPYRRRHG